MLELLEYCANSFGFTFHHVHFKFLTTRLKKYVDYVELYLSLSLLGSASPKIFSAQNKYKSAQFEVINALR